MSRPPVEPYEKNGGTSLGIAGMCCRRRYFCGFLLKCMSQRPCASNLMLSIFHLCFIIPNPLQGPWQYGMNYPGQDVRASPHDPSWYFEHLEITNAPHTDRVCDWTHVLWRCCIMLVYFIDTFVQSDIWVKKSLVQLGIAQGPSCEMITFPAMEFKLTTYHTWTQVPNWLSHPLTPCESTAPLEILYNYFCLRLFSLSSIVLWHPIIQLKYN